MYKHVDEVQRGRIPNRTNTKLGNKIKKILSSGNKVKYNKVFETYNGQEAYNKEKELISEIGLENLCNLRDGGKGGMCSEETKRKISESLKGRTPNEETKRKLSKAQLGKDNHFYGKHHSKDIKEKISQKLKDSYKTGKFIGFFGKTHTEKRKNVNC